MELLFGEVAGPDFPPTEEAPVHNLVAFESNARSWNSKETVLVLESNGPDVRE
jgi:hypothetical protein